MSSINSTIYKNIQNVLLFVFYCGIINNWEKKYMNDLFNAYKDKFTIAERKKLVADSLRFLREDKKKTQKEIAEAIGINVQTYSSYERGRNETPAEILVRLSLYYEISLDTIMQRNNFEKSSYNVIEQFSAVDKELQTFREKLFNGDEKAQGDFKILAEGLLALTQAVKDAQDIAINKAKENESTTDK